eukprot:11183422-Lingulodinium_polyedra.AAC.1
MALVSSGKRVLLADWAHWALLRRRPTRTKWPGESRSTVSLTRARTVPSAVALKMDCTVPV